jgi:eukaryotic-like serine/threonine-protein kinase
MRAAATVVGPRDAGDPVRIGRYRIVRRLGSGGMGTVYLAQDRRGRPVALKVLHEHLRDDPRFRRRFAEEVAAAARVATFCAARVLDADPHARRPYLVTEYVDGITLHDRVMRHGPLTSADVSSLAVGVAAALTAIHAAGVVHRDLKPGNVMLAAAGPKVIDFGIAGAVSSRRERDTAVGFGTPGWLAPERMSGHPAGPPADVFAWGLLVAWAATGRHPFAHGRPDLAGLPPGLESAVRASLVADPARRPTARELLLRLCGAGEQRPDVVRAVPRTRKIRPAAPASARTRRPRRARGLVLVSVIGALLVAAWFVNGQRPSADAAPPGPAPPAPAPSRTTQPAPPPPARPPAARTPGTVRDGAFEFKVTGLRCGATSLGEWPTRKAAAGRFCLLDLRVHNRSGHPGLVFPGSQRLVDAAGTEYGADPWSWVYHPGSRPFASPVKAGATVTGTLVFDLPLRAKPVRLIVHDTPLSDGARLKVRAR